jgi:hypothetical protein
MDVFKLAFETTIVGLLTLVWLGVVTYLLFPDFLLDLINEIVSQADPAKNSQAAIGAGVLTMAYCLGSAILPVANQLVNDEHWPLNENAIRCQVITKLEYPSEDDQQTVLIKIEGLPAKNWEHCSYWAPVFYPAEGEKKHIGPWRFLRLWFPFLVRASEATAKAAKDHKEEILALFLEQESKVLDQPTEKTERLRQLHERIVVLHGSVFSLFILMLICLLTRFARVHGEPLLSLRTAIGILVAFFFIVFAGCNGAQDLKGKNIFDIPILESLLLVISLFGLYLVIKGVRTALFRPRRYVLIVLFFTFLTYGGWMWSEILYDQQIITTFAVLQNNPETPKP